MPACWYWSPRASHAETDHRPHAVASDVGQSGNLTGDSLRVDDDTGEARCQQWLDTSFDNRLPINGFGYLARNYFNYARLEMRKRKANLPGYVRSRDDVFGHRFALRDEQLLGG